MKNEEIIDFLTLLVIIGIFGRLSVIILIPLWLTQKLDEQAIKRIEEQREENG